MLDDILGGVFGWFTGEALRRWYFARKARRARSGDTVRVRVKAHPDGSPYWRYWRGALVKTDDNLRFRALIRRWRSAELTGVKAIGAHMKESAADGDRMHFTLYPGWRFDHLAVTPDRAAVVEVLLLSAR